MTVNNSFTGDFFWGRKEPSYTQPELKTQTRNRTLSVHGRVDRPTGTRNLLKFERPSRGGPGVQAHRG